MLKPRPPFACLRSTTVLCFRKWEFSYWQKDITDGETALWQLRPAALWRTYIYLGFAPAGANHVQLLYGQRLFGQLQADVVRIVGLLIVLQSNSRFCLSEIEGEKSNYVHNEHFNPLLSTSHLCSTFHWSRFNLTGVSLWTFGWIAHFQFHILTFQ